MSSSSPSQKHLMAAVAHGWHKPGGGGPSVAVAKEFNRADAAMNKGYSSSNQKFAEGGAVLGKTSQFLKTPDQFRASYHKDAGAGGDKSYGKSGPGAGTGEVKPPAAKGKCLPAVKPKS